MSPLSRLCRLTGKPFIITDREQEFCAKIGVPLPTVCPEERLRRRLCERNSRSLYWRTCDFSKKKILSRHHENVPFPVYDQEIWWSDKWDALEYGRDFDFNRPFFEQFKELKNVVPHMPLFIISGTLQNSEYTNNTGYLKNCYLIFESDYDEECYYANLLKHCQFVVDCSIGYNNELCYECIDCSRSYHLLYSQDCHSCRDSYFLYDCQNCSDCIGSVNQRHKQFMIFNQQLTKEDYEQQKKQFNLKTATGLKAFQEKFMAFKLTQPHRALQEEHNENCLGDHLYNSKNSDYCFDSKDLEDCLHCAKLSLGVKSSMDYNSWGDKAELIYQSAACGDQIYNLKFCSTCTTNLSNATYCDQCTQSSDLFGCVGLKKKKYCILNKQYSQAEYGDLVQRLISHMKKTNEWGEFFPIDLCPFGYNETQAMDSHPLTKEEAASLGYSWKDPDIRDFKKQAAEVPDSIDEVNEGICQEILACATCGKNYKIIPQELQFYKKMGIPVPKLCPDDRHKNRMSKRNPFTFWERTCAKTGVPIMTTYSPDRPEIVYSKEAYLKEVY